MRPRDLKALLKVSLPARPFLPVLVKSAPGMGKTDIAYSATVELDEEFRRAAESGKGEPGRFTSARLYVFHPAVSDPTDYKGLPGIVEGKAEFLPYGDLRVLCEAPADQLTVALLDDVGQAPAVVQAAVMQLLLARQVNGVKISDSVSFLANTNRREDRAGVTGILEPVKSRFASIIELECDVDDWCDWALRNGMPAELLAFVRFRPNLLNDVGQPTQDFVNRPCPRTVANVGKWLNRGVKSLEVIEGAAGKGFAAEFVGFLRVWESLPSIEGILLDPDKAVVPTDPAARYAVAAALALRVSKDNAGRVVRYAGRLPDEFGVLLVRDSLRKCPAVANCREFTAWAIKHQDVLK